MPKKIDHEARKLLILQAALKVFAREGYKDSNLSLIAGECGLSRPTIYQYFKDKREIYHYAVKLVTSRMFAKYVSYVWSHTASSTLDKLSFICADIIHTAVTYVVELTNLVEVMLQVKREGRDFEDMVMHRTAKLAILFKRLIRQGVQSGELAECDVENVSGQLLLELEGACLRIALFTTVDENLELSMIERVIRSLGRK